MILLVPKWAFNYEEFWNTIKRRNLWFIKIRYFAVLGMLGFIGLGALLDFRFSEAQIISISAIALSILIYNIIIQSIRPRVCCTPNKFNAMHLSLIQMVMDLTALMMLIYYTGTIESPLYVFFIFHMVIGSLILPGYLIYLICGMVILVYSVLIGLQFQGIIPTHNIAGLYESGVSHTVQFYFLFLLTFSAMMVITVLLANRIAANLLKREGELKDTLEKLNEAEKAKQKYIIGVVHEIKSPISAAQSLVDLVLQKYLGPLNEAVEVKVERISLRLKESIEMINNILRISKLKLLDSSNAEEVDVKKIIEDYVEANNEKLAGAGIDLTIADEREKDEHIFGDHVLLEMAFSNIIGNGIKYIGKESGGLISIEFASEEDKTCIKISDNGIGIPEKDLEKIFGQFFRVSNKNNKKVEGSGLGLSVVHEIITQHGGTISAKSPSGIGTEEFPGTSFIVTLPHKRVPKKETESELLKGGL